ncbi:MAG: alkane 1-monooxygenase [Kangiellaceae bacterium]|nr:alkane 1-monooxygenase [Kangiellaceae bacterium]
MPQACINDNIYTKLALKRWAYLLFLITPCVPFFSWWLGQQTSHPNSAPYFSILFFFVLVPILDWIIGKDSLNVPEQESKRLSEQFYYQLLTLITLPIMLAVIIFGAIQFTSPQLHWLGQLGWILNIGIVGGVISINVAHELIHKNSQLERSIGGLLLSLVCYGGFKVEHVRGHHVNVSTPLDASSAKYNQSLYHFLPRAYRHNFTNAWKLEALRLKRKELSAWSFQNELVIWYFISFICATSCAVVWGWQGLLFFLGQSFVALTLLEIINYIEHYGLERQQDETGKFERVTHHHSWNSNYFLTNILLIQLQRHSDHHAFPKRRYQVLRHFDDSPQLPAGYATMVVIALFPALWRKIMNPIIDKFYSNLQ